MNESSKNNAEFLSSLIKNLSKEIPYHWRVQSFSKNKPVATCVAYISARDAVDLLNEHAIYGWHREYYTVGENTYCRVGVVLPDGSTQWRSDCGVESQADAEKGQASDAFKRACVSFGIGRFLYDLGMEYVTANEVKSGSNFPHCIDDDGSRIWDLTKYITDRIAKKAKGNVQKEPVKPKKETPKQEVSAPSSTSALQPSKEFDTPKKPALDAAKKKALEVIKSTNYDFSNQSAFIKLVKEYNDNNPENKVKAGMTLEDVVRESEIDALRVFHTYVQSKLNKAA